MATSSSTLEPGRNCWRVEEATRATVIVDAEDYFRIVREAMRDAKHRIMLIGWDFDARIKLVHDDHDDAPSEIGHFITWLVDRNPDLNVNVLRWDTGALKSLSRGRTIFTLAHWWWHKQIHLKLDGFHPVGASHHQKIVVIDDCIAFCGGIDMTDDRWDTRAHDDNVPERTEPDGTPYGPWHDAITALSGPVAKALGDVCRNRWKRAGGGTLDPAPPVTECWPESLPVQFRDCRVAISRSIPEMPGFEPVREIETLYLDLIARAEKWIYAESQYFASRRIAEAMAKRLEEPDGPEIVIVNPVTSEGWLEPIAMDTARARLVESLRKRDTHGRFRIYHAMTAGGQPIYIHAKVTVIDGKILRVGSSNFNNRSMRLDTECDVTIDSTMSGNEPCADGIARVAHDLVAEHFDSDADTIASRIDETGSLIETIETLPGSRRRLRHYQKPDLDGGEKWLADNELLDPENPDELFEPVQKHGLLHGLRHKPTAAEPGGSPQRVLALAAAGAVGLGILAAMRRRDRRH